MKKKVNSGKTHNIIKHKNIKFKKRKFTKPKTIHHTFNNLFDNNFIENIKEEFTPQKSEFPKYEPPKESRKHNFFSFLKHKEQKPTEHKEHENKIEKLFKHKKQIQETKKDKKIILTLISEIIFFMGMIIVGASFLYKPLFKFLVVIGSAIALVGVIMFFQSMLKVKIKSFEQKQEKKIILKETKTQEKIKNKKAPLFISLIILLLVIIYLFIKQRSLLKNITTRISPVILISIILVFLIIVLIILITIKKSKLKKVKTSQEHKEEVILRAKKHLNVQLHQLKQTETELDSLLELINENGVVSLTQAAKVFNVTQEKIKEWAKILEDHNLIKIFYPAISEPLLKSLTIENAGKKDNRKV